MQTPKDGERSAAAGLARSRVVFTLGGLSTGDHAGGDIKVIVPPPGQDSYRTGAANPAWSHDGTRVAYMWDFDIWVVGADGSNPHPVAAGPHGRFNSPRWSPDDTRIYFNDLSGGSVLVRWVDVDGIDHGTLPGPAGQDSTSVVWSPAGDRFAVSRRVDGRFGVFVFNADGTSARLVSLGPEDEDNFAVDWSSDGSRLLVVAHRMFSTPGFATVVVNIDGTSRTTVRANAIPDAFSPDDRRILWHDPGNQALGTMRADGSDARLLEGMGGGADWGPGSVDPDRPAAAVPPPTTAQPSTPTSQAEPAVTLAGRVPPSPTSRPRTTAPRPSPSSAPAGARSSTTTPPAAPLSGPAPAPPSGSSPPKADAPDDVAQKRLFKPLARGAPAVTRTPATGLAVLLLLSVAAAAHRNRRGVPFHRSRRC